MRGLLVLGGANDPNLDALSAAAERAGVPVIAVRVSLNRPPVIDWRLRDREIVFNGQSCEPAAAFYRHDVFDALATGRAESAEQAYAWFIAMSGWCCCHPTMRTFNRTAQFATTNKVAMLACAAAAGLKIPDTRITNSETAVRAVHDRSIAKPVAGGAYCESATSTLNSTEWRDGVAPAPALLQEKLDYPEYRIYVIDDEIVAFRTRSLQLDYRRDRCAEIECLAEIPDDVRLGLLRLARSVGLDYGAADFKTDSTTGELVFLEFNTTPMFASFDLISGGALTGRMVAALMSKRNAVRRTPGFVAALSERPRAELVADASPAR